jgi:hypothetical protein
MKNLLIALIAVTGLCSLPSQKAHAYETRMTSLNAPNAQDEDDNSMLDEDEFDGAMLPTKTLPAECKTVGITADQKKQIHDLITQSKADMKVLRTAMKDDFKAYETAVLDPAATLQTTAASESKISDDIGKMTSAHIALHTNILLNVLRPDQRQAGLACRRAMFKRNHACKAKPVQPAPPMMDFED